MALTRPRGAVTASGAASSQTQYPSCLLNFRIHFRTKDIKQTQTLRGGSVLMTRGDKWHCSCCKVMFCSLSATSGASDTRGRAETFLREGWGVRSGFDLCLEVINLGTGKIAHLPHPHLHRIEMVLEWVSISSAADL